MKTIHSSLYILQVYKKKMKKCPINSSKIYYLKVLEKSTRKLFKLIFSQFILTKHGSEEFI
jgi:hypothetical protein